MNAPVSIEKFKEVLPLICDAETSADPKGWTPENPLWGHCACELYCAGVNTNGLPYHKKAPEFTCLRCAVQIYNAGVKTVYVPFDGKWVGLSGEECVKQVVAYATKEKTI